MLETILKYITVFLVSMVKFFIGPFTGLAGGLTFGGTLACTIAGMMSSVILFSIVGGYFKKFWFTYIDKRKKRIFTNSNRRIVDVWRRFGIKGLAFLTPPLLTPIVGTLIAIGFGVPRRQIYKYMFVSAILWGTVLCLIVFKFRDIHFSI